MFNYVQYTKIIKSIKIFILFFVTSISFLPAWASKDEIVETVKPKQKLLSMQSVSSFFQRHKVKNAPQLNKVVKTKTTEDKILTSRQDEHSVKTMTRKFEALFNENASSQPAHTPAQNEEIKAGHVKEMKEFYQSKSKYASHKPLRSNSFIQKRENQNNTVSSKEQTDLNNTSTSSDSVLKKMFNRTRSFTSSPTIRRENIRKKEGRKNKEFLVSDPTRSPIMDKKEKRITSKQVGKQLDDIDLIFRVAKLLEDGGDVNQVSYDAVFKPVAQTLALQAHKVIKECSKSENIENPAKMVDILRGVENGVQRCANGLKYTTDCLEDSGEVKFLKAREEEEKNVNSQNIHQSVSPFLMVSQPKRKKRGKPIKQQEESNSTGILRQRAQTAPATPSLLKKSQG